MRFQVHIRLLAASIVGTIVVALSALNPATAIISAENAQAAELYTVAVANSSIYTRDGNLENAQFCGGALVRPRLVITAAHCVSDYNYDTDVLSFVTAAELVVGGGVLDLRDMYGTHVVTVEKVAIHPEYVRLMTDKKGASAAYDVALLHLSAPIAGATIIAVASPTEIDALSVLQPTAWIAGWGEQSPTGSGVYPNALQRTRLSLVDHMRCGSPSSTFTISSPDGKSAHTANGLNASDAEFFDAATMLCAMGLANTGNLTDSCFGDSGGPIAHPIGTVRKLIGITSWGPTGYRECAIGEPGVYTAIETAFGAIPESVVPTPAVSFSAGAMLSVSGDYDWQLRPWTYTAIAVGSGATRTCQSVDFSSTKPCTFTGLQPNTTYAVTTSQIGSELVSTPAAITTGAVLRPENVRVSSRKFSAISATRVRTKISFTARSAGAPVLKTAVTCTAAGTTVTAQRITALSVGLTLAKRKIYSCAAIAKNSSGSSAKLSFTLRT